MNSDVLGMTWQKGKKGEQRKRKTERETEHAGPVACLPSS